MNQVVDEFNHCEASANKELSKMKEKSDKLKDKQNQGERAKMNAKINTTELSEETKRNTSSIDQMVELPYKSHFSTTEVTRQKERSHKIENDLLRVKTERIVKDIFNCLGIRSAKELPHDVEMLEKEN